MQTRIRFAPWRRQLVRPCHVPQLTRINRYPISQIYARILSSHSRNDQTTYDRLRFGSTASFLCACIVSSLAGYIFATRCNSFNPFLDTIDYPRFGTPDDFKQAIYDLRQAFPTPGSVSTDYDELQAHGLTGSSYLPGMW